MTPTIDLSCRLLRRHSALAALVAAGLLWGLTVPLSKLVLDWLPGGWLTVVRFALAAPLLAFVARRNLRAAITPRILFAGAIGYGLVIVLQNAGIESTSVSHAALIVGAVPALVALIAALTGKSSTGPARLARLRARARGRGDRGRRRRRRRLAGRGRAGAAVRHASATFVVVQPSLLRGRDPIAVTAVQMIAGALAAVPERGARGPAARAGVAAPVVALVALASPARCCRSRCSPTGSRGSRPSSRGRS